MIVEQHDRPGGYAHGFRRKQYWFDAGVHLTSGCRSNGYRGGQVIYKTLSVLGKLNRIQFVDVNPMGRVLYPDHQLNLALPEQDFCTSLAIAFPHEKEGLIRLIQLCLDVCEEAACAEEVMRTHNADEIQTTLPNLIRYRRKTLSDVYKKYIRDKKLQAIFASQWPYLGLPPEKVSFVYWATMFIGYLHEGTSYCVGGFQKLAETYVTAVEENDGLICYKKTVKRIMVENKRVTGVVLDNGDIIYADQVISNADMKQTMYDMIGQAQFSDRQTKRIQHLKPSLSIFAVYLATDLDVSSTGLEQENFCYPGYDHDVHYNNSCQGQLEWLSITIPTLIDPHLAPPSQHLIMLNTLMPYQLDRPWKELKPGFTQAMIEFAEKYLPGLTDHILYVESGSPTTMQRYTLNEQGAAYGWELTPDQVGVNRVGSNNGITGLHFAGHWASPGGGIYGVSVSGMQVAQSLLGFSTQEAFWSSYRNA